VLRMRVGQIVEISPAGHLPSCPYLLVAMAASRHRAFATMRPGRATWHLTVWRQLRQVVLLRLKHEDTTGRDVFCPRGGEPLGRYPHVKRIWGLPATLADA